MSSIFLILENYNKIGSYEIRLRRNVVFHMLYYQHKHERKTESKSVCQRILEVEISECNCACGEKRSRWPTESQNG